MKLLSRDRFTKLPSAVLIDLDNTLYAYNPAHEAGLKAVARKARDDFDLESKRFGELFLEARTKVKARLKGNTSARNRLLYFQELLEIIGLGSAVKSALEYEQTYWIRFLQAMQPFIGINDFFDNLRLRGIPTVLLTNLNTKIQLQKLVYLGLEESFSSVVTSEQAGAEKPSSTIFNLAADRLKLGKRDLWMIGDDLNADMQGAKKALNCTTILKTNGNRYPKKSLEAVDAYFDEFSNISNLIDNLGRKINAD